jgi:hypothetical protein
MHPFARSSELPISDSPLQKKLKHMNSADLIEIDCLKTVSDGGKIIARIRKKSVANLHSILSRTVLSA